MLVYYMNSERHNQLAQGGEMDSIKNEILNRQERELERNAKRARLQRLEQAIREWPVDQKGFAGLRRLQHQLNELKETL